MDKFKELVSLCKCSIELSVNPHRDYYESVKDYMIGKEIEPDVLDEMIKRDTIVAVHAYPTTPIGSFVVYHYDIDMALDLIISYVKNEG